MSLTGFNTIFDHLVMAYFFGPPCIQYVAARLW